jgi:hypothetical protein
MLDVGVGGGVGDGAEAVDPPPQPARLKVNRATKITGGEGRGGRWYTFMIFSPDSSV